MGVTASPSAMSNLAARRVFVTGHTGFKGCWITALLTRLGAEVCGYALPATSVPSLAARANISGQLAHETLADIRDAAALQRAITQVQPEIVIHMAAQALVRQSYTDPVETWSTNVMGTVNVLEAVRSVSGIRAVVVVTTDKCYENRAWAWGYRETDRLGGHDPYSASKAATELVAQSYRNSFFEGGALLATARAGNVIGGGDWSADRILADAARAASAGKPLIVRNSAATRPWQHVLDCLSGYLTLAGALWAGDRAAASAFNFGPDSADNVSVAELLERLGRHWPELIWQRESSQAITALHEAPYLHLDSSRARQVLRWRSRWTLNTALEKTAEWYRAVERKPTLAASLMASQIDEYLQ